MTGYDVAMSLLQDGLQAIPLNYEKKPKVSFGDIPITEDFINANCEAYYTSQAMALLCRGIWCMDIDINHARDENGFESLQELEDVWPDIVRNAQQTYVQYTPRGGRHLVFKKCEGIDYGQHGGYLKGVDIKAHDNNFFVMSGSQTVTGVYTDNGKEIQYFDGTYLDYFNGTFEDRIFSSGGSFDDQTLEKYKVPKPVYYGEYTFQSNGQGGKGKQAYQRIVEGVADLRNEDLFLAASYAKACNVEIEPLKILIGTRKGKDIFTETEFWNTVNSAQA